MTPSSVCSIYTNLHCNGMSRRVTSLEKAPSLRQSTLASKIKIKACCIDMHDSRERKANSSPGAKSEPVEVTKERGNLGFMSFTEPCCYFEIKCVNSEKRLPKYHTQDKPASENGDS